MNTLAMVLLTVTLFAGGEHTGNTGYSWAAFFSMLVTWGVAMKTVGIDQ